MPEYEYFCPILEKEFDATHSIKIVLEDCPLCKEAGKEPHAPKRLISGGSGKGIVELYGDDLVKKTKEDAAKFKKEVYSNADKYANVIGEAKYNEIQSGLDRGRRGR